MIQNLGFGQNYAFWGVVVSCGAMKWVLFYICGAQNSISLIALSRLPCCAEMGQWKVQRKGKVSVG